MLADIEQELVETAKVFRARYKIEAKILEAIQSKWPAVISLSLGGSSLYLSTDKHSVSMQNYNNWSPEITMICDKETMPDTVEEFLEAKALMQADYKECLTAAYWLMFRYTRA